jgi:hypothetical protein
MKNNKFLITAVAAMFGVSIANADISLADNLSLSGFVDASYSNTNDDGAIAPDPSRTETIGLDQVELDFAISGESVSAEVHLDSLGGVAGSNDIRLEQAFASYDLGNGLTVSGGRMLNLLGYESDEPTGLYTQSYAYTDLNLQDYKDGVRASFGVEDIAIGLSAYDSVGGADLDLGYEAQVIFTGIENLTVAVGVADSDQGDILEAFNVWASYESGQMTLAAEYSDVEAAAGDGDGYLLLVNYTINDNSSITVRYSEEESDAGTGETLTISPNYSFTDNLGATIEYSTGENAAGDDVDVFAIETTFTF